MDLIELKENEMQGRKPKIKVPENYAIAGGAVRRWFAGEKQDSDIDFFRIDGEEDYSIDIEGLSKAGSTIVADTYFKDSRRIQVIKRKYESISDLFENFDFHHCQFSYTDGKILTTKKAILSALRKHLSFNTVIEGFEVDTLRRAFKYQRQGFTPCAGTLGKIANTIRDSTSDFDEQVQMSPSGGKHRVIRFD